MPIEVEVPQELLESIGTLPVLPTAVTRLVSITQNADVGFRDIAAVVETDPTLMARTLRVANSPLYSTAREIKTVQQATVLLGTQAVVELALGVSVASVQNSLHDQLPIDAAAFARHSVAVALAARRLARHYKLRNSGEAFVIGLLHDIGKLVLLMHYGEAYAQLLLQAQQGGKPLDKLEREAYGLDHAVAGYALCRHWQLPASMGEAVAVHHSETEPLTLGDIVRKANDLVKTIQLGNSGNRYIEAVYGVPEDLAEHGWLRKVILDLPEETEHAEEALGHTSSYGSHASKSASKRLAIQLQIADPEALTLVMGMLLSMGFDPAHTFPLSTAEKQANPYALVTDAHSSDRRRRAYELMEVPVLDFALYRQEYSVQPGEPIDVALLGAWLSTALSA